MVLIDKDTKVIVQGITGRRGSAHTKMMLDYGTAIVGGVTPGKGGEIVHGTPVYDTVKEAVKNHKPSWSVIFVPAAFAMDAAIEAIKEGLHIVIITEGVPVHDTFKILAEAEKKDRHVIGPNCPGIVVPGVGKVGIMPGHIFKKGTVGIVSRSGTLTYEIVHQLTAKGIGQSAVVGIGGDPVKGLGFIDVLKLFESDPNTEKIIFVGEIGGSAEEEAAKFIKENITKKVVAYIAGRTAPEGKTMGHAGAIISGTSGTAKVKVAALEAAGVAVAKIPSKIVDML